MDSHEIIIRPLHTEKSVDDIRASNTYHFEVDPRATKSQIRHAVQEIFPGRRVMDVRTISVRGKRRGFLPFDTNPFDRVFVSIILMVAIHLLWMRFVEEHITLTVATILTLILSVIIFLRG